jgi:hypothetical protein
MLVFMFELFSMKNVLDRFDCIFYGCRDVSKIQRSSAWDCFCSKSFKIVPELLNLLNECIGWQSVLDCAFLWRTLSQQLLYNRLEILQCQNGGAPVLCDLFFIIIRIGLDVQYLSFSSWQNTTTPSMYYSRESASSNSSDPANFIARNAFTVNMYLSRFSHWKMKTMVLASTHWTNLDWNQPRQSYIIQNR